MKLKDVINNMEGMDFTDFTIRTIEGWLEEDVSTPIIKSDIYEENNQLIIEADLPGVDHNSVECFIYNNAVYIQGVKLESVPADLMRYNQIERAFGNFTKVIPIQTTCDTRNVKAVLKNGVLKIILKKIEERRHTKTIIKIEKG
jgi:HSP20 family protein